jgi:hypothetical protein
MAIRFLLAPPFRLPSFPTVARAASQWKGATCPAARVRCSSTRGVAGALQQCPQSSAAPRARCCPAALPCCPAAPHAAGAGAGAATRAAISGWRASCCCACWGACSSRPGVKRAAVLNNVSSCEGEAHSATLTPHPHCSQRGRVVPPAEALHRLYAADRGECPWPPPP